MKPCGHTLVEMMVALTLASTLSLGALTVYLNQSSSIHQESQRGEQALDAHTVLDRVDYLLRHAIHDSIRLDYGDGGLNEENELEKSDDALQLTFALPRGLAIWPNDQPPFERHWLRLFWHNNQNAALPYALTLASAERENDLPAVGQIIAGGDQGAVINFDVWPLSSDGRPLARHDDNAAGGYLLRLSLRAKQPDPSYVHPRVSDGQLRHYRSQTLATIVAPRN